MNSLKTKSKKAEMSSKMLITIILLVVGFVIILLVYSLLDWKGLTDSEICHQSVVMRGTLPGTFGIQSVVPLTCKTDKICVRGSKFFGKGSCENNFGEEERVRSADVKELRDVEKLIADEIVNCWSMMGKGEVSLFPEGWKEYFGVPGGIHSSCVICSRIAFDTKTLNEKGIDVSERNVLGYMMGNRMPNSQETYYSFLMGGKANMADTSISQIEIIDSSTGEKIVLEEDDLIETIEESGTEEIAILFMQIAAPSGSDVFRRTLGYGLGGAVAVGGARGIGTSLKALTKCFGPQIKLCAGVALVAGAVLGAQQLGVSYNKGVAASYCGDVAVGDEARDGCSVVRTIKYDRESIQQYCGVIESIS